MSFISYGGILFAIFVLVVYQLMPGRRSQNGFLLCCSIYFYATSNVIFTGLLLGTIAVGFVFGILIERRRNEGLSGKPAVTLAIIILLMTLL